MKKAALLLVALFPITAIAQPAKPIRDIATLVRLRYAQPDVVKDLAAPGSYVTITANNALKAVVVKGHPEDVADVEKLIQQIDVPPPEASARNVEVTVYIIGATNKATPQAASVPQNLESVVRQLKAIFPYSTYALLDSMLIRSREGREAKTSGMLKDFPAQTAQPGLPNQYGIDYQLTPPETSPTSGTIHFYKFDFRAHERTSHTIVDADFETNLDLPENQKVVVGKTDIDGGDAALFVVLSGRIEPTAAQ